jgi:A/G-specific adenine glycosylase
VGASIDRPIRDRQLAKVLDWWDANARDLPWRATRDRYAVWVSEVMSTQTTVGRAAEAWARWIERWPTVESLAAASLSEVLSQWQGLGYPRRARDLHRSAQLIVERGWPEPDHLTELPGVGRYIADAIRCFALEEPILPRDVNIDRVLSRRFRDGVDITSDPWRSGQALMEFGQRICSARPCCGECPVRAGCTGPDASVGAPGRRQPRFEGSVRQRSGRLLRQVLSDGSARFVEADDEAANGLIADGLLILTTDGRLTVPS